ncbi:MAG: hypothetical protein Q9162_001198 [Coniocarpon cinnabarinum]
MLRVVLPRQRHVWVNLLRRSQSSSTPPTIPQPPTSSSSTPQAPSQVPPLPPNPSDSSKADPGSQSPSSPPPSTPKPRPRRRIRRFFFLGSTLLALAYGGGTYLALVSDSFHDYFTDYVPFGENAVLFFEERAFKQRFASTAGGASKSYPQISGENKVTVGRQSGVSAKAAEEGQASKGTAGKDNPATSQSGGHSASEKSAGSAIAKKKDDVKEKARETKEEVKETANKTASTASQAGQQAATKTREAVSKGPIKQIDTLSIDNAADPLVQNISKILNDVIIAVNADNASGKYGSTISKAKDEVQRLAGDITAYSTREARKAEDKIRESQVQFDQGAQELLARISREQRDQELAFREEYEAERERLAKSYETKLSAELEAVSKVADERRRNELLEQSVKLTDEFAREVRDRVEKERESRLSRLNELARDVEEMESLSKSYASVLESNLQTQHLITAVEAVRTALDDSDRPKPFIHELVALKEIAHKDAVVEAAIGSIDPTAYQRGISTTAQIMDRFRKVADEVRKASLLPEDAGAASHAASFMLSRFMFKKEGLAVGDDVESVLTRTETFLEEGNLDDATREMNGLTGWARVLSRDWLAECRRALEVRQALDVSSFLCRPCLKFPSFSSFKLIAS